MSDLKQAMLLAAGFSKRVRPLTEEKTKPMLPFWNRSVLDFSLTYLQHYGIQSVGINIHHAKKPFLQALQDNPSTLKRKTFVEEGNILGTGGGIKNMRSFVQDEHFLVMNCDFLTDVSIREAMQFHLENNSLATAVLIDDPRKHQYGLVGTNAENKIVQFPHGKCPGKAKRSGLFTGIHIFRQDIFDHMPNDAVFGINRDVYAPLIEKGKNVFGFFARATWLDVGTTKDYADSQFTLLKKPFGWTNAFLSEFDESESGTFIHKSAELDSSVRIQSPTLISEQVKIEKGSTLGPNTILGPRVVVSTGSRISEAIIFPGLTITENSNVNGQIVPNIGTAVSI